MLHPIQGPQLIPRYGGLFPSSPALCKQTIQYVLVRLVHVSWVSSESGLYLQVGVSVWIHHSVLFFGSPVNGYLSSVVQFWQLKKGAMNILAHILWKDAFIDLGWIPGMELQGTVGSMVHFIRNGWLVFQRRCTVDRMPAPHRLSSTCHCWSF